MNAQLCVLFTVYLKEELQYLRHKALRCSVIMQLLFSIYGPEVKVAFVTLWIQTGSPALFLLEMRDERKKHYINLQLNL